VAIPERQHLIVLVLRAGFTQQHLIGLTGSDLFGHSAPNKVNLWGMIKQIVLLQTTGI